ncbi:MAG: peptidoglycan DD-metalloendopeptidase family protein [Candidatus Nanopelagicales bacterium]
MHSTARRLTALLGATAIAVAALVAVPSASQAAPKPGSSRAAAAPELAKGDKGEAVRVLQRALKVKPVSGYFGPVTLIAVQRFQEEQGLPVTGVVGVETWAALGEDVARAAAGSDASFGDVQVDGRFCPAVDFTYGDGMGAGRNHMGFDLMGKAGSPIYAIDAGKVTRSGYQGNGALILDITGKGGQMWFYGHFSKILFSEGDQVKAGQLIGYMGDTGSAGAVHLHAELRPNGWSGPAQDAEPIIRQLCAGA